MLRLTTRRLVSQQQPAALVVATLTRGLNAAKTPAVVVRIYVGRRFMAATAEAPPTGDQRAGSSSSGKSTAEGDNTNTKTAPTGSALGQEGATAPAPAAPTRNIIVMSTATKAVYVHFANHISSWYWMRTDFHPWLWFWVFLIIGLQLYVRWRAAKMATAQQARLGETLLDQRTRELLSDIEQLRGKDPLRLEHEANAFHDQFWARRAKTVAEANQQRRTVEMQRGIMQGEARGTDMTEWLGAKQKDEDEREVARRTHDYIQGFHQHLKAKRLI